MPSSQVEMPGQAVAAAADRDREVLVAGEPQRGDDLGGVRRPDDQRGPAVDHPVPHGARRIVGLVAGQDHVAREPLAEGLQAGRVSMRRTAWSTMWRLPCGSASCDESPGDRWQGQPIAA